MGDGRLGDGYGAVFGNGTPAGVYRVDNGLTDRAMRHIETHRSSPFFVYLAFNTPHSPMQVPDRCWNKYKDMELKQEYFEKNRENAGHTRAAWLMSR